MAEPLFWTVLTVIVATVSLVAAGHALLLKRDPRSALGWIAVCLLLPLGGAVLYWILGINRVHVKAKGWQESGRRVVLTESVRRFPHTEIDILFHGAAEHFTDLKGLADRVVSSRLMPGNRIVPLHNGEECYPAMLAAIEAASHSIHLSSYIFDGGGVGGRIADALQRAAQRGVQVRVIIDSLGEKYSRPTARERLKGSKVEVGRFLPLRQGGYVNLRNHRKLLVIDGRQAFTGGMNIGERHMLKSSEWPKPVVDVHFQVDGPVVGDFQKVFLEDWYFVTGQLVEGDEYFPEIALRGSAMARAVADGPDKNFRKLHCLIMGALSCARERVQIMTPYFIPDRALISALGTTALRGVDVEIILPAENNLPMVNWASRAYLWELAQQGIRIYYQPGPFVHSKLLVIDGLWSLIGSANLDPRSLRLNFEFNVEVYAREFAQLLSRHMDSVIARSHEVTLVEADGRPLPEKIRDSLAKLFSPYL